MYPGLISIPWTAFSSLGNKPTQKNSELDPSGHSCPASNPDQTPQSAKLIKKLCGSCPNAENKQVRLSGGVMGTYQESHSLYSEHITSDLDTLAHQIPQQTHLNIFFLKREN